MLRGNGWICVKNVNIHDVMKIYFIDQEKTRPALDSMSR